MSQDKASEMTREELLKLCDGLIEDSRTFHINANVLTVARELKSRLTTETTAMPTQTDIAVQIHRGRITGLNDQETADAILALPWPRSPVKDAALAPVQGMTGLREAARSMSAVNWESSAAPQPEEKV